MFPKWTEKLEMGYGFAYASGWEGLGIYFYNPPDYTVLWFVDDFSSNSENENLYNEFMRMNILEVMEELPEKEEDYEKIRSK